ncbi:SDR family oxidoreductase [Mycolicibacterium iranicum]|uniref:SDR family oxidoreductase n=1 Tax=Mycolicibacterium iranicum TaxID=912594 RepID=A0ABT4HF53_MYCIR|nr:SDR family oxidoreductase [Mycolicibacterium iranicum]MCZ0728826.1 SDR family oxidoreductase [Mycolicibacterium iranicum]
MPIRNKVVAVTGGGRGIGRSIAVLLSELGAHVAIGDLDAEAAAETGSTLGLKIATALDVTDEQSFRMFLDSTEATLGPVDVLVNNAGIISVGPFVEEPDAVTRRVLEVNAYGVMLGSKLALARMRNRGSGHIINIASTSSLIAVPGVATYSATKHAVLGFTDALRLENRRSGVHFSVVLPALTNTEMISGVGKVRGIKNIDPIDVARAVARLIEKPRPRTIVPRSMGAIALPGRKLLPRWAYESIERMLGGERVFQDDVNEERRTDYTRRIQGS